MVDSFINVDLWADAMYDGRIMGDSERTSSSKASEWLVFAGFVALILCLPIIVGGVIFVIALVAQLIAGRSSGNAVTGALVVGMVGWMVVKLLFAVADAGDLFKKTTRCPYCEQSLRTERAQQCGQCGADWHDPDNLRSLFHDGPYVHPQDSPTERKPGPGNLPPSGFDQWS